MKLKTALVFFALITPAFAQDATPFAAMRAQAHVAAQQALLQGATPQQAQAQEADANRAIDQIEAKALNKTPPAPVVTATTPATTATTTAPPATAPVPAPAQAVPVDPASQKLRFQQIGAIKTAPDQIVITGWGSAVANGGTPYSAASATAFPAFLKLIIADTKNPALGDCLKLLGPAGQMFKVPVDIQGAGSYDGKGGITLQTVTSCQPAANVGADPRLAN